MPILTIPPQCRLFPKEISRINRIWRRENVTSCRERIRLFDYTVTTFNCLQVHHEQFTITVFCIRSFFIFTCALLGMIIGRFQQRRESWSTSIQSSLPPSHPDTLTLNSVPIASSPHFSSRHSSFKKPSAA